MEKHKTNNSLLQNTTKIINLNPIQFHRQVIYTDYDRIKYNIVTSKTDKIPSLTCATKMNLADEKNTDPGYVWDDAVCWQSKNQESCHVAHLQHFKCRDIEGLVSKGSHGWVVKMLLSEDIFTICVQSMESTIRTCSEDVVS